MRASYSSGIRHGNHPDEDACQTTSRTGGAALGLDRVVESPLGWVRLLTCLEATISLSI